VNISLFLFRHYNMEHMQEINLALTLMQVHVTSYTVHMVYKSLSGSALSYITELCVPVASIRPRSALRSVAHSILKVPWTCLELGKHAFAVTGPPCLLEQPA